METLGPLDLRVALVLMDSEALEDPLVHLDPRGLLDRQAALEVPAL